MSRSDRIVMMISIISRGKGKAYIEMLNGKNIRLHLQCVGHGTAPSDMMDIFGLSSNDKDIVISLAATRTVEAFSEELEKPLDSNASYGGLLVIMPLSAINRLPAEILFRISQATSEKGAISTMNNDRKYHYIFISVNQGYTDQVMQTAKKAGATGGTVIRGRMAGGERLAQFGEIDVQDEKEIIMILAPVGISNQILQDVNREYGMKTPAQGMVCALPVEKAFKI